MNVKKFLMGSVAALFLSTSLVACGPATVPAGYVGVKIYLLGSNKGVDNEALPVGWYWLGLNEDLITFPTFMQNYTWTKADDSNSLQDESISFQTIEGMTVNADVGISYQIDPTKVSTIFQTYRRGIDEITNVFLRNMVRDALVKESASKKIESIYGSGKADLIASVQQEVSNQVKDQGIIIDKVYWIGEIRLPETVVTAINAKNQATQMAEQRQNEVAQAQAEAQKQVAAANGEAESIRIKAQAQADANLLLAKSLTPELVQYKALETWDGKLPQYTGGPVPFIGVNNTSTGQ